jgi:hypothetical protein
MKFVLSFLLLLALAFSCAEPNCVFCGRGANICEKCSDGYGLFAGKCEKCHDRNCIDCPDKYSRCKVCKDGYRVAASSC